LLIFEVVIGRGRAVRMKALPNQKSTIGVHQSSIKRVPLGLIDD
jgi:hypothetical protein